MSTRTTNDAWLQEHSVFRALRGREHPEQLWPTYVEAFAMVVYSVPAFLGVTLARADENSLPLLSEIWSDELGTSATAAHPVLFQRLRDAVVARYGARPEMHAIGLEAAAKMTRLCASGPWPVGVAAMKAHESQFPTAYGSILGVAREEWGAAAEFFDVHAAADVEHSRAGTEMLIAAEQRGVAPVSLIEKSYETSSALLKELMDGIWEHRR